MRIFRFSVYAQGMGMLMELGLFDSSWRRLASYLASSTLGVRVKEKYSLSDQQFETVIADYAKFLILALIMPQSKVAIPCMIVYEILKLHLSTNHVRYKTFATRLFRRVRTN